MVPACLLWLTNPGNWDLLEVNQKFFQSPRRIIQLQGRASKDVRYFPKRSLKLWNKVAHFKIMLVTWPAKSGKDFHLPPRYQIHLSCGSPRYQCECNDINYCRKHQTWWRHSCGKQKCEEDYGLVGQRSAFVDWPTLAVGTSSKSVAVHPLWPLMLY